MRSKSITADEMGKMNIFPLIMKYSSAVFAALMFSSLYNIVDSLFVSYGVGDNAMGAVSVIYPFVILQAAFAQTVGGGAAVGVSLHLGKKEYEKAGNITLHAMLIFYCVSILSTIFCLVFCNRVLSLLGAVGEIYSYAKEYFVIIALGNAFSTGFSSIIRAEGKMRYSLMIWLLPTAVNIIMDYLFIFKLKTGVSGAATATVIGQLSSFLMSMLFFKKFSCQKFNKFKFTLNTSKEIIFTGIPSLFQIGASSVILLAVNMLLSLYFGSLYVDAFAYISKIIIFVITPFNAISTAIAPIIGYNYGFNRFDRIKKTLKISISFCALYTCVISAILIIFSKKIMNVFTDNLRVITLSSNIIHILLPSLLFLPLSLLSGSYFQAIGNKKLSYIVNSIIVICVCLFSALFVSTGESGIWYAVDAACLFSSAVSSVFLFKYMKNM